MWRSNLAKSWFLLSIFDIYLPLEIGGRNAWLRQLDCNSWFISNFLVDNPKGSSTFLLFTNRLSISSRHSDAKLLRVPTDLKCKTTNTPSSANYPRHSSTSRESAAATKVRLLANRLSCWPFIIPRSLAMMSAWLRTAIFTGRPASADILSTAALFMPSK